MKDIKIWKMALIWFGTSFLVSVGLAIYLVLNNIMELNDVLMAFIMFASILVATMISGRIGVKLSKERLNNFKKVASLKEILIVVGTQIFLSLGLSNLSLGILSITDKNKALEVLNDTIGYPTNNMELVFFLITIVILAPILEEIVFRRVVFTRLNKKFNFIFSAVISSLIFAIGHEFLGMLGAVVFGVACCVLYRKYNNLLVPIAVHFINNLLSGIMVSISYFDGSLNEQISVITNNDIMIYFISGILLTAITMIIFVRFVFRNKQYLGKEKSRLQISI